MKRILVVPLLILSFSLFIHIDRVKANTISRIYGITAQHTTFHSYDVFPFDPSLGTLDQVDISIRGIVHGHTYNPTFPNISVDGGLVNIFHDFYSPGWNMFDLMIPAQLQKLAFFTDPIQLLPPSYIDLNFSLSTANSGQQHILVGSGYLVPPTITGNLSSFIDDQNGVPHLLQFTQTVNWPVNLAQVTSNLFMQIDYHYTPPATGPPSIINPGSPFQVDPGVLNLFPGIVSVRDISNDQLYALAASSVPEPATMLLLGTSLIGLAGLRRRIIK